MTRTGLGFLLCAALAAGCETHDGARDEGGLDDGPGGKADDLDDDEPVTPDPGADAAVCAPENSIADRIAACRGGDDPLLQPASRPTDPTDLLYYVNRWYSTDPCFPFVPSSDAVLQTLRRDSIDPAGGLEPELHDRCGSYDVELVPLPAAFASGSVSLRRDAWEQAFRPMFEQAEAAGVRFSVLSGFRSAETQKATFDHWAGVEGGNAARASVYAALPLHSEHQLGTTADVTATLASGAQANPFADPVGFHLGPAGRWLRDNAHRFGIVVTYQPHKVHLHQYKPEPWHLRWVGEDAAALMHECDLSTEEVLAHRYGIALPLPAFENMDLVHAAVAADGWSESACFDDRQTEPSPFCAAHSVGGWCDGGDAVVCSADGTESSRLTCAQGCCTMMAGVADACAEDLDDAALAGALSCTEGLETSFCGAHSVGGWCDGGDAVLCAEDGTELERTTCADGCCTMAPGVPDACAEDLDPAQVASAISCSPA